LLFSGLSVYGAAVRTIGTFSKVEDAHLLRMRLEAGGIEAFLQDENIVQMDWMLSNAYGGVRVQVADADVEAALDLLSSDPGIQSTDEK
jgi:hypothetical protein